MIFSSGLKLLRFLEGFLKKNKLISHILYYVYNNHLICSRFESNKEVNYFLNDSFCYVISKFETDN